MNVSSGVEVGRARLVTLITQKARLREREASELLDDLLPMIAAALMHDDRKSHPTLTEALEKERSDERAEGTDMSTQFEALLDSLGRGEAEASEMLSSVRAGRHEIEAGLRRISENNREIRAQLQGLRSHD